MDCELAERVISRSLDGEASAEELRGLDEHCASCEGYRGYRARQAKLHEALQKGLGDFSEALRPRPRAPKPRLWRGLARIAALLVLVAGSVLAGYHIPRGAEALPAPDRGKMAATETRRAGREEPRVMMAETEQEAVRNVLWDPDAGLRTASRIDRDRMYRVAAPNGDFEIEWRTTDSLYRLVGFHE